mgnify:CR=1 FL=1
MDGGFRAVIFDYRGVIAGPSAEGEGLRVYPQMVAALDRLAAHGLRLGCITNNTRGAPGDAAVLARFEQVVESARVGLRKPDPRIFALMGELLDLRPQACLYLDDIAANCAGAASIGMHAIKVESPEQALGELGAVLGMAFDRPAD